MYQWHHISGEHIPGTKYQRAHSGTKYQGHYIPGAQSTRGTTDQAALWIRGQDGPVGTTDKGELWTMGH